MGGSSPAVSVMGSRDISDTNEVSPRNPSKNNDEGKHRSPREREQQQGKSKRQHNIGLLQAVMEVAQELDQNSSIPGVSEAATWLSVYAQLLSDHLGTPAAIEKRIRWCQSTLVILSRAEDLLGKVRQYGGLGATGGPCKLLLHHLPHEIVQRFHASGVSGPVGERARLKT